MDDLTHDHDPTTPDAVAVTGSEATPDVVVPMLAGETGARLPTGDHAASRALPTQQGAQGDRWPAVGVAGALVVLAIIVVAMVRIVA